MMKRALMIGLLVLVAASGSFAQRLAASSDEPGSMASGGKSRSASTPAPVQLTTGGCCTQPFWSTDGKQVRYIDKPVGGKLGIYGVTAAAPEPRPVLVSERIEDSRIVGLYRIDTTKTTTTLVRVSDGKRFNVPAQGRDVQFSPDFKRIAWSISNDDASPERQVAAIWVSNVDGSGAKKLATLRRGGIGGWISANELLVNGQNAKSTKDQVLWALDTGTGKLREIARAERLRSPLLSPSGRWVAYYTTFAKDGTDGMWLVDTSEGKPRALLKEAFGAYQWRSGPNETLVVIPFKPNAQYQEFWQLDPQSRVLTQLTRADETALKIANGDWRVSPDGRYVAYVESKDRNIWVLQLP